MLRWRLVGAVAILLPLLLLLWLEAKHNFDCPGCWLYLLGLLFAVAASCELTMLRAGQEWSADVVVSGVAAFVAVTIMFVPAVYHPSDCPLGSWGWTTLGLFAAVATISAWHMRHYQVGQTETLLPYSIFSVCYVVLLLSFVWQLRLLHRDEWGVVAILSIATTVKFSDAGAYFVGRFFGNRPMAPALSPKKTVEGAIGGIITAVIVAMVLHLHLLPYLFSLRHAPTDLPSLFKLALYGFTLAVAGIFGDLAESYLKRVADQKDSARWLPGLGGCLDVLDSVLWAAPIGYLWWAAGLIGPVG